jgi:hypothetical protein
MHVQFVEGTADRRPLGRARRRWVSNVAVNLTERLY